MGSFPQSISGMRELSVEIHVSKSSDDFVCPSCVNANFTWNALWRLLSRSSISSIPAYFILSVSFLLPENTVISDVEFSFIFEKSIVLM